jgi:hypothetical protein
MSELKASGFSDEFGSSGPDIVGLTTFTSPYYFVPPSGSTAQRPSSPPPGMLRFNTDIGRLEVWRNDHWATILGESPNLGNHLVTNSAGGTGVRGVWGGGYSPGPVNTMDYVSVPTLGNAQDFGNLGVASYSFSACGSATRGLFSGYASIGANIYVITFASTGDAIDSGADLSAGRAYSNALSNSTRGVIFGGSISPSNTNIIDYVTIASLSNAQDFGDLVAARSQVKGCASPVRGLMMGGQQPGLTNIEYITISTTGNAQDYGDLSSGRGQGGCVSSATRGVHMGGTPAAAPAAILNTIEFVTIATTGNTQDFGDLSRTNSRDGGAACSSTRGVFGGGDPNASPYPKSNAIDYITIATTGNSIDFGDLTDARNHMNACSNGHGGL